jgi:hypothetical protein
MRIVEWHSHLNGWEHIKVLKPRSWEDIEAATGGALLPTHTPDAFSMARSVHRSPSHLIRQIGEAFTRHGWQGLRSGYEAVWDTDVDGSEPRLEMRETDRTWDEATSASYFLKDRIAVDVSLGRDSAIPFQLLAKHMAFYVGNVIDVGVEVLPMKAMSAEMSSGISYYEGELYNVIRQGRGVPAVPLVILGIAP